MEKEIKMRKYLNTFNYKGKEYYIGSVVRLKGSLGEVVTLTKHYVNNNGRHVYDFQTNSGRTMSVDIVNLDCFLNGVVEESDCPLQADEQTTQDRYYKDSDLDVMFYGWVIYIVAMVCASFCKGNVFIWLLVSIYFFFWRKKKLEKD